MAVIVVGVFSDFALEIHSRYHTIEKARSLSKMKMSPDYYFLKILFPLKPYHRLPPNHLKVKGCIIFIEILKVETGDWPFWSESEVKPLLKKLEEMLHTILVSSERCTSELPELTFAQSWWPWAHGREKASNVPFMCLTRPSPLGLEIQIQVSQEIHHRRRFLAEIRWGLRVNQQCHVGQQPPTLFSPVSQLHSIKTGLVLR